MFTRGYWSTTDDSFTFCHCNTCLMVKLHASFAYGCPTMKCEICVNWPAGWWFQPLWKIWKSLGIIIPNIWKVINSCSKPPTSQYSSRWWCYISPNMGGWSPNLVNDLTHVVSIWIHMASSNFSPWHLCGFGGNHDTPGDGRAGKLSF